MLKLNEDEARGFDAIIKAVGVIALIAGGAWTLTQYFLHRAEERQTAAVEARKPFLERRLQVYSDIVQMAATIANGDDLKEVEKAKGQFAILSLGPLTMFGESEVRAATAAFAGCLRESTKCDKGVIASRAASVAVACRRSLGEGWGLDWPAPPTGLKVTIQ
jgi:hypothetical protein